MMLEDGLLWPAGGGWFGIRTKYVTHWFKVLANENRFVIVAILTQRSTPEASSEKKGRIVDQLNLIVAKKMEKRTWWTERERMTSRK